MRQQVLHSLKWVAVGKAFSQTLRWLLTFWVIRILTPQDYGYVAMSEVALSFLTMVLSAMFSPYLVQSKVLSDTAIGQALGLTFVTHVSLAALQYTAAPLAGAYFQTDIVTDILRTNAVCFLFMGLETVPSALMVREMRFKRISLIAAFANGLAAVSTLGLAYLGFGFWALVYGEIIFLASRSLLVVLANPIRVLPRLRGPEARSMLNFGGLLSVHAFLAYVFLHMDVAIAGRVLTAAEVGVYAIALQIALMPHKKIMPMLRTVAFPAFSRVQETPGEINRYLIKAQRLCLLLTVPIFWGAAAVAGTAIPLILGAHWTAAAWPTTFILLIMPLRFSLELYTPALKSQRRVREMIGNSLTSVSVMLIAISVGARYGATGLALAWTAGFPLAFTLILRRNAGFLGVPVKELARPLLLPLAAGTAMLLVVSAVSITDFNNPLLLLISQVLIGAACYLGILYFGSRSTVSELLGLWR